MDDCVSLLAMRISDLYWSDLNQVQRNENQRTDMLNAEEPLRKCVVCAREVEQSEINLPENVESCEQFLPRPSSARVLAEARDSIMRDGI